MRKLTFVFLLTAFLVLGGFSSSQSGISINEVVINTAESSVELEVANESTDIKIIEGVDTVLKTVEALQFIVEHSPEEAEKLNKLGEKLDEDWDLIEEKVEKQFPKDYENIEESLYPLIDKAQSETPNIDELKRLMEEVNMKLSIFKEKITS